MKFHTEVEMSRYLRNVFVPKAEFAGVSWLDELTGVLGIPDYVLVRSSTTRMLYVVAVELKLRNWKQGLLQAYRYRNFANESYLVIDEVNFKAAHENLAEFQLANVGLATFNKQGVLWIHFVPQPSKPFSPAFAERMVKAYLSRNTGANSRPKSQVSLIPAFVRTTRARIAFQGLWPGADSLQEAVDRL